MFLHCKIVQYVNNFLGGNIIIFLTSCKYQNLGHRCEEKASHFGLDKKKKSSEDAQIFQSTRLGFIILAVSECLHWALGWPHQMKSRQGQKSSKHLDVYSVRSVVHCVLLKFLQTYLTEHAWFSSALAAYERNVSAMGIQKVSGYEYSLG